MVLHPQISANVFKRTRIYTSTAVTYIVADRIQEVSNSQVLRIMIFSRLMLDSDRSGTGWFAKRANLLATQPVRPQLRLQIAGNSRSTGLRSGESPYPLRT
ncbi:MAG: hypothetical protein JWN70_5624 [Planctomycetaceae bacterium]|nr:hypothetical protein [Planctomycetaceae bacterium]